MESPSEYLLIIDDDEELCSLLSRYFEQEGYQLDQAHNLEEGVGMALSGRYSVILLDVLFPGSVSGFDILRSIRTRTRTPVLMLSARGDDIDRIVGLEMGADDYLSKPLNPRELLARIRTVLRRTPAGSRTSLVGDFPKEYRSGDLRLDCQTRTVFSSGKPIGLTGVEFEMLKILLGRAGCVVTREELVSRVLGRQQTPYDRSVDVHISRLRRKLGPHRSGAERIRSVRGSGYIYTTGESAEQNH